MAGVTRSVIILLLVAALGACGTTSGAPASTGGALRLGYFPNLTHATAIVGIEQGMYADALGPGTTLTTHPFNAGTEAIEALFSGAIDATYIGPNPAINAFARSDGKAIRIVAGATSGGAALVVRAGIEDAADLAGTTLGSPALGNTQDVALRAWLAEQGYSTSLEGAGDVSIQPQANGQILDAFAAGSLDGAWVPEPWATRLVEEGGGHVLVDERDLWPDGRFVTTHLIVSTAYLERNPDLVRRLLEGHVEATTFVNEKPADSQALVAATISELTGTKLEVGLVERAWAALTFTNDPIAASLKESARQAESLGLLEPVDLTGIHDLGLLNEILVAAGEAELAP